MVAQQEHASNANTAAAERKLRRQVATRKHQQAARQSDYMMHLKPSERKLILWAERNGLPKAMAENPAKKASVKKIIARMKAEAMVASIKSQFEHDDERVGDIVHSADPAASKTLYAGLDYK